jgi:hypothetical protein
LHGLPFVCDNGILIPYEHECNGKVDCADVSDENNCTRGKQPEAGCPTPWSAMQQFLIIYFSY